MSEVLVPPTVQESSTTVPQIEDVLTIGGLATQNTLEHLPDTTAQNKLPLLAHWAVKDVLPIASSTDLKNPDTSTWRKDTEDSDT